jgi:hypothetical protein
LRDVQRLFLEHSKKRHAERGYAPTSEEWVQQQPEKWRAVCAVFAVNVNTSGGVVGKTIDEIVATANGAGVCMSRRTLMRRLPDLERHGVLRQERNFDWSTGTVRRKSSTWLLGLRKRMPDVVLPPADDSGDPQARYDARNEAWLRAVGEWEGIEAMRARVAVQPAEPWF